MEKNLTRNRPKIRFWTDLSDLYKIHNKKKCFIVGAGPSLNNLCLDKIHNDVVISVNSSSMLMPWGHGSSEKRYWVSNDSLCLYWSYFVPYVCESNCNKIVRTSWKKYDNIISKYGFRYFAPRVKKNIVDPKDNGLFSVSSVPTSIDLAIFMGCNEIYLLGVDHCTIDGKSHFWQFWDNKKHPTLKTKQYTPSIKQQKHMFNMNINTFKILNEYAKSQSISIKNCSRVSVLDMFEKEDLDHATS